MSARETFVARAAQQILVFDGGYGTAIQGYKLSEADYRGDLELTHDQKGNNDLLSITRPDVVGAIHSAYLEAGADMIETNTFSATKISMADYGCEHLVRQLNIESAKLARACCEAVEAKDGIKRFVAGSVGPTNKTLSLSPDVNDPGYREIDFDYLKEVYREQCDALIEGGVDFLLIETIFDTLNAKAAIFAVEEFFDELGERLPVMISGTITDLSGRTLSGQTVEAFWHSVRHANPWSVGLNCALGPKDMDAHIRSLARAANVRISAYPNAGLPNAMGGYDEGPADMVGVMEPWAGQGVVNIMGGCCGTTPAHIRAIAEAAKGKTPRKGWVCEPVMRLSGLEPFTAAA